MLRILRGACAAHHPYPFHLCREGGVPYYVLLLIRSTGVFFIDSEKYNVPQRSAVLISPGTSYRYYNPNGDYVDDWLHFECLVEDFEFPPLNTPFLLSDISICSMLLRQILWEKAYTPENFKEKNLSALFFVLINHLRSSFESVQNQKDTLPYTSILRTIRLDMQNAPEKLHNICSYAKLLKISESYFQHLYSSLFHISFQKDLIQMRIDRAKTLLVNTNVTIDQIALLCGYGNEVHFYRQFKSLVGTTPSRYREMSANNTAVTHESTD